jgi:hypothetical protein
MKSDIQNVHQDAALALKQRKLYLFWILQTWWDSFEIWCAVGQGIAGTECSMDGKFLDCH